MDRMPIHNRPRYLRCPQKDWQKEFRGKKRQQTGITFYCFQIHLYSVSIWFKLNLSVCVMCLWPQGSVDEEPEEMPPLDAETVQVIPGSELIWKITPRPDNSAKVGGGDRRDGGRSIWNMKIWINCYLWKYYLFVASHPCTVCLKSKCCADFILSVAVLCILHVRHAVKWTREEHGRRYATHRQSPQTWHSRYGEWRYRYDHIQVKVKTYFQLFWVLKMFLFLFF